MKLSTQEIKTQALSISKWAWARRQYIFEQRKLGRFVSPINIRDPAVIKRDIVELLDIREKLRGKTITQTDVEHFHQKYIRSKMTRQAQRKTMRDLLYDALNPYDLAMALEIPLPDTVEALLELESEQKIKPISDALGTVFMGAIPISRNPNSNA